MSTEALKLDDIEQYRMQMAGICTAAIGYWKEGDPIHPDYDTLALRDVAKLYAKYAALAAAPAGGAEPVATAIVQRATGSTMHTRLVTHAGWRDLPDGETKLYAAPTAQPRPADAEAVGTKPGYPQTSRDWLAAMVDIWEDGQKFESGEGCYVAGALGDSMREAKAHLARTAPTLLNGLTEQETAASASVAGLSGAQPEAPAELSVTPEMITAYLQANDAYWHNADSMPLNTRDPSKWRSGTPREATLAGLRAALAIANQAVADGPAGQSTWPFVEHVWCMGDRLERAYRELDGDMHAAFRRVMVERPSLLRALATPAPAAQQPAELTDALRNLVEALDATNWSSWQSTAKFSDELDRARDAILAQGGSQ